jgi:DNA polymerase elongation subunit (family B)
MYMLTLEMERLDSSGTFNLKKWEQEQSLTEQKENAARQSTLKDAELKNELARLEVERQRLMAAPIQELKDQKVSQAKEMFEMVQCKKRERMALNQEKEKMRLEQHQQGSEKTISVLENIAANSTDPQVQLEALKQLADLRKTDVEAQKGAYKDD